MKDFTRMDNLLKGFVEQGTNPGCAVAVMQGDEMIYHGEAGYHALKKICFILRGMENELRF